MTPALDFAARFQAKALPLRWRGPGMETLDEHLAHGDEVIVFTAAPTVLARDLDEAGQGKRWAYAYTHSLDDLPLLRGADAPMILGCGKAPQRRLSQARLPNCRASVWSAPGASQRRSGRRSRASGRGQA